MKILVVEDEQDLNSVITRHLKKQGYSVDSSFNGEEALDFLETISYDLAIVDIMMPKMDGYTLINRIRDKENDLPILVLTAKDTLQDKVMGLDLGADDYVVKPFEFEELLARIRALVRRKYGHSDSIIKVEDLILDLSKKQVYRNGVSIDLTGKEYEILEFLMHNQGGVISREQILNHVWDFDYDGSSNMIDVLIKNIRKKIDLGDSRPLIFTKRGLGYILRGEYE